MYIGGAPVVLYHQMKTYLVGFVELWKECLYVLQDRPTGVLIVQRDADAYRKSTLKSRFQRTTRGS